MVEKRDLTSGAAVDPDKTREKREAVMEAARRINQLFPVFQANAVEITKEWWQKQLAGEEGVTYRQPGVFVKDPIFEKVMTKDGRIVLNGWSEPMGRGVLGEPVLELRGGGIKVTKYGFGNRADVAYMVTPDNKIMKVGYDVTEPYSGPQGNFPGRVYLNENKLTEMVELDDKIQELLDLMEAAASK